MSLPDKFIMFAVGREYYVRREDKGGYKLRSASYTDEYAESIGEYPYWDTEDIERYINNGSWQLTQDLDVPEEDVSSVGLLEDVI